MSHDRSPFAWIGSAISVPSAPPACAKGVVLPASYMTGTPAPAYLPGVGAGASASSLSTPTWLLAGAAILGGVVLWHVAKTVTPVLEENPSVTWPTGSEWRRIVDGANALQKRLDWQAKQQDPRKGVEMEWAGRRRWARYALRDATGSRSALYFLDKTTGDYYLAQSWKKRALRISGNVKDVAENPVIGDPIFRWKWSKKIDPVSVRDHGKGTLKEAIEAAQDAGTTLPVNLSRDEVVITLLDRSGRVRGHINAKGKFTSGYAENPWPPRQHLGYGKASLVDRIVMSAGWSFDTAMSELKSDGVARKINGLLYVLTDDSGDTIPSDPKEPVLVGVYVLNESEGEWIQVGDKIFPDVRSALRNWQSTPVDVGLVQSIRSGDFVPGYAENYGYSPFPADAIDPEQLDIGTEIEMEHTTDRAVARQIARDHLREDPLYYVKLLSTVEGPFGSLFAHPWSNL